MHSARKKSIYKIDYQLINTYLKILKYTIANSPWICTFVPGELAEWSIAAVLKTVEL